MKALSLIRKITLAFAAVSALAMVSCSESDEPTFDKQYSRSLSDGTESAFYVCSSLNLYDQNPLTNGKWKKIDLSDYYGWSAVTPSEIIIHDGKIYTNYKTWSSSSGLSLIGRIWSAYLYSTKKDLKLSLSRKFAINDDDSSLDLGYTTFTVGGIDKSSFQLIHFSKYVGGESQIGGTNKEIADYEAKPFAETDNTLMFDTERELMQKVIDLAREHFGEILDCNKVYKGMIIFNDPESQIYNLHDVEVELGLI